MEFDTTNHQKRNSQMAKIRRIVDNVERLPPLSAHVSKLLREIDHPNASAHTVTTLVKSDMVLAGHVLRAANAAALGYTVENYDVHAAVVRLGFSRLRNIVLGFSVAGPLTRRLMGYGLKNNELWNHSLAVAMISQRLSSMLGVSDPAMAYMVGLLHDIGKVILDRYVLEDYARLLSWLEKNQVTLWRAEEDLIGIDHATLGGLITYKWGFAETFVEPLRHHHFPSLAQVNEDVAAVVNLADFLAPRGNGSLPCYQGDFYHPVSLEILNMSETSLQKIAGEMTPNLAAWITTDRENGISLQ